MEIMVQVSPDLVGHMDPPDASIPEVEEISHVLEEHGCTLEPLHPYEDDPSLSSCYVAYVPDDVQVDSVLNAILECEGIVAAYRKPPGEAP